MINGNNYDALTNNGIQELFSDNFQGQQFTLQIIYYKPSKDEVFSIFLSDGFTWIRGEFIGEAKAMALRSNDLKVFSVITFLSEDIEMNGIIFYFKLKRIQQVNSRVHKIIGEPILYEDFKKKGCINQVGSNKIQDAVNIFKINQVKEMATGKVSGTIIAKVIRKPDKVNSFLNIIIEDDQQSQIQCCFFGKNVEKYYSMLVYGSWYRFQDPVLQANNRKQKVLQLKITDSSKVVKMKMQNQVKEVGILKTNTQSQNKPKHTSNKGQQIQFKIEQIEEISKISEDTFYFVIARVLKISNINNGIARALNCVDRYGKSIEITIWNQYDSESIQVNETYRFGYLRAKFYRGMITLHSRKKLFTLKLSQNKIFKRSDLERTSGDQETVSIEGRLARRCDKILGRNDIVCSIRELIDKSTASTERVVYVLTYGTTILKYDFYNNNNHEYIADLRKKLFYISCNSCESNDYVRGRIEPEFRDGVLRCGNCQSTEIKFMWNIKINFVDQQQDITCKVNSQIVEKITCMTTEQGIIEYLKNPQALKKYIIRKLNLLTGVFKISAKINEKKVDDRFFNICQSYADGKRIFLDHIRHQFNVAVDTYKKFDLMRDKIKQKDCPLPSFLQKIEKKPVKIDKSLNLHKQQMPDRQDQMKKQYKNDDI